MAGNGWTVSTRPSSADETQMPFRDCELELFLHLQPRFLASIKTGVYEQLCRLLMVYHDDLHGVVTDFSDVRLRERAGRIIADDPRIHVHVKARATVFAPAHLCLLRGTINKISCDHIGLLVHDAFNAAVGRSAMPEDYVFDHELQAWGNDDPAVPIMVGATVQFAVIGLEAANGVMSIVGSLLPADLQPASEQQEEKEEGNSEITETTNTSEAMVKTQKKKKKNRETSNHQDENSSANGRKRPRSPCEVEEPPAKSRKKKKLRDHLSEAPSA